MSRYAAFGLDDKKKSTDEPGAPERKICLWCNQRYERGFYLCFSNFIICKDCANGATHVEQQHRWQIEDCFKCDAKETVTFAATPPWQPYMCLCKDCIDWAREVLNKPPVLPQPKPGEQLSFLL